MLLISPEQTPGKLRQAFLDRMRELGWIDGKTIQIHARYAGGALDRLPGLGRCCGRPRTGTRSSGDAERGPLISSRAYHKCIPSTLPQTVASASPLRRPCKELSATANASDARDPTRRARRYASGMPARCGADRKAPGRADAEFVGGSLPFSILGRSVYWRTQAISPCARPHS